MSNYSPRIKALDGARGWASVFVAVDHFILIEVLKNNFTGKLFYLASFMGSFAVGLFFLISGFIIPGSLFRQSIKGFVIGRVLRLYPVFALVCLLRLFVTRGFDLSALLPSDLKLYLLNVSMIGNSFIWNTDNIEPIVWTLAVEVKFYFLCGLAFYLAKNKPERVFWNVSVIIILMACASYTYPHRDTPFTSDMGVALSILPFIFSGLYLSLFQHEYISKEKLLFGVLLSISCLFLGPYPIYTSLDKGLPSFASAAIVFYWIIRPGTTHKLLNSRLSLFLGKISYPMYGIHTSIAILVVGLNVSTGIKVVLYTLATVLSSYALHLFVEEPCARFLKRNRKKWKTAESVS